MTSAAHRRLTVLSLALALSACAVPPKPDAPSLRKEAPLAGVAARDGGSWPAPEWWHRYNDPQLDALEQRALAASPSLDEAHKRFGTALRSVDIARAAGGASVQANGQVQRERLSENGLIPPQFLGFTWYNQGDLSLQFQYDFDFWGKQRAAVEASVDEARAAEAERSTATLMLTTAVADTYLGWQADQARLGFATTTVAAIERSRSLTARRVARGIDPPDYADQADAQLAGAREIQVAYRGSAEIRVAALAALLGIAPAELPPLQPRPLPTVDGALPDNVGIDLLARRPDIAASRWRIEAAMQRVDEARAEFYPDISLGAMAGLQSLDLGKLFSAGSRVAGIGPAVHLPVFGRERIKAAYGVSQAQLEAAASQYDAVVVDAARDVATQALTLQQVEARRRERALQLASAERLETTANLRAKRGLSDDRSVLAAQQQVLQQRDALATLDAQALSAELALTKALGGGYRSGPIPARPTPADATPAPSTAPPTGSEKSAQRVDSR